MGVVAASADHLLPLRKCGDAGRKEMRPRYLRRHSARYAPHRSNRTGPKQRHTCTERREEERRAEVEAVVAA